MSPASLFPNLESIFSAIAARGRQRPEAITFNVWNENRTYVAFDLDDDTFVFEKDIWNNLENKLPIIAVPKADLHPGVTPAPRGFVFTLSHGNHAATSIPLLTGKFWDLADIPREKQSETLSACVLCGNCVDDALELSQRDVHTNRLRDIDLWLQDTLHFSLAQVVIIDRVDSTLDFYRRLGQEWRIRPLAWTPEEIASAVLSSKSRIRSRIRYYHNVKGVHCLTYPQFLEFGKELRTKPENFRKGLAELVGTTTEDGYSFMRRPRYAHHHEIEVFGVSPVFAMRTLVPELERLYAEIDDLSLDDLEARFTSIAESYRWALLNKAFESNDAPDTLNALYRHITGEVYLGMPGSEAPAFDDRRTALPGATYIRGVRHPHVGCDGRTSAILSHLEQNVGRGEVIEYVNIYEIRSESEPVPLGKGKTREIVYKTSWEPLPVRKIEKRLAQTSSGYGTYTMARVRAFRALGIAYGPHRLLARSDDTEGEFHYFTRDRYPGECFTELTPSAFHVRDIHTGRYDSTREDPDIVRAVMTCMGGAAAENMILKKRNPDGSTIRYAEGKEIIEFGYDVHAGKEMPLRTWLCSIRGTMADADRPCVPESLVGVYEDYATFFARVILDYTAQHPVVARGEIVDAFLEGFRAKTNEIFWNYNVRRELFDAYSPDVDPSYHFESRWKFILWSLEHQCTHLDTIAGLIRATTQRLG